MNDPISSESCYAVFTEAEFPKDFIRVLPEGWRSALNTTGSLLEIDGHSCHSYRSDEWMMNHWIHPHCRDLRVIQKRKVVADSAARHAFLQ